MSYLASRLLLWSLLTISVFSGRYGTIKIISPASLVQQLEDHANDLKFTLANFGEAPFGKSVLGEITLSKPKNSCSLQEEVKDFGESPIGLRILMADRGDCQFATKAHFAQMSGYGMLIMVNNNDDDVTRMVLIDNNSGMTGNLKIPTIMINKADGELVENYIMKALSESKAAPSVKFMISFEWPVAQNASIDAWLSATDSRSYQFVNEMRTALKGFEKSYWNFTPHYVIWHCLECAWEKYETTFNPNCLSGGRYCAPDPDKDGPQNGRDVVYEVLTQICIQKNYPELWWNYMKEFGSKCLQVPRIEDCSNLIMNQAKIKISDIQTCINASFASNDMLLADNSILASERQLLEDYRIVIWPSIAINNYTYRGNLESDYLLDAICDSLEKPPHVCQVANGINVTVTDRLQEIYTSPRNFLTLAGIVAGGVLVLLIVFFCVYRRTLKRELHEEMNSQIQGAISQYMQVRQQPQFEDELAENKAHDKKILMQAAYDQITRGKPSSFVQFRFSIFVVKQQAVNAFLLITAFKFSCSAGECALKQIHTLFLYCLLYTSPSPRDQA
eukprot:TRINITY_DN7982_c0_g1_i1.p1 TRINITY_DN7982_c0_g1~~TRINITY_DN7982_c0_g1_i1.p1  ORF type:complete len:560 (+),score=81.01 TRINITY_DN7982_c0_g1_i1:32-1711(+)